MVIGSDPVQVFCERVASGGADRPPESDLLVGFRKDFRLAGVELSPYALDHPVTWADKVSAFKRFNREHSAKGAAVFIKAPTCFVTAVGHPVNNFGGADGIARMLTGFDGDWELLEKGHG